MTALRYLSLEGNRIRRLPDEAFQNLHYLSRLNLAFNELEILDFAAFDSIGTLSHLTIDLSHNALQVRKRNIFAKWIFSATFVKSEMTQMT